MEVNTIWQGEQIEKFIHEADKGFIAIDSEFLFIAQCYETVSLRYTHWIELLDILIDWYN